MIAVLFWLEQTDKESEIIFSWYTESFPVFQPGSFVWLEKTLAPIGAEKFASYERMPLAPYRVVRSEALLSEDCANTISTRCQISVFIVKSEDA